MKYRKISINIQKKTEEIFISYPSVRFIVHEIASHGGRVVLVGGAVRDMMLGLGLKDLDIEVHKISLIELEGILKNFGPVSLVGKSFGVLRLHGLDVDWSLPRTDTAGRKPTVTLDPGMSFDQAFARRDLTINAMGIDLITGELIDPFGGKKDLQEGILRTPNPLFFIEDPLRFYRVMQFISRFGMYPDAELNRVCTTMDLTRISRERIEGEFEKMLLKSVCPSLGIAWLKVIGRLDELFPELGALVSTPQDPGWHPEGSVFEHSLQALDAAASFSYASKKEKLIVLYAALCHDLGKITTTELVDGRLKSIGHAVAGVAIAGKLLRRITRHEEIIDAVKKLVRYHLAPSQFIHGDAKLSAYKRLAKKLAPHVTLKMLAYVALADKLGRNPARGRPLTGSSVVVEKFLQQAEKAQVVEAIEQPVLLGRDLLDTVAPGPLMGKLLKQAYELQLDDGITDKLELKKRVLELLKKKSEE